MIAHDKFLSAIKAGYSIEQALEQAAIPRAKTLQERAEVIHKSLTRRIRMNLLTSTIDQSDVKNLSAKLKQREMDLKRNVEQPEPRELASGLLISISKIP